MTTTPISTPALFPGLQYRDADAAMRWLEDVLGCERREDHRDEDGNVVHAELVFDGALVMLSTAGVGREPFRSLPAGGRLVYCAIDDVDSLYERVRGAGGEIAVEITDTDYGSRDFTVRDPEGNLWAFGSYRPEAPPRPTAPANSGSTRRSDFKLELVPIPVSDVERAKAFYQDRAGFTVDNDVTVREGLRFIQLTPPGSACSISIGQGTTEMEPGSVQGLQLVVDDVDAARDELSARGVAVSEVQDFSWGRFVFFSDPDGNGWAVQQIPDYGEGRTQPADA